MTGSDLADRLCRDLAAVRRSRTTSGVRLEVDRLDVAALARSADDLGLRLGAITGTPSAPQGETEIVYHFVGPDGLVDVATTTRDNTIASLAPRLRPAGWAEREIHDLFGVDFVGHPDPSPLLRPEGFDVGMMRAPMCAARRRPDLASSE